MQGVAERYLSKRNDRTRLEVWKPTRNVRFMRVGEVLRVHGDAPFTLRWSSDNWKTVNDSKSTRNALQIDYVDLKDATTKAGDVSLLHVSLDGGQSLGGPRLRSHCSLAASARTWTIEIRARVALVSCRGGGLSGRKAKQFHFVGGDSPAEDRIPAPLASLCR